MRKTTILALLVLTALLSACTGEGDFTPPAFLHVDAVEVAKSDEDPLSLNDGFYCSDIVAVYVVAHYPSLNTIDTIGLFRLPFTTPVLFNGKADYIDLYPAVEQSGISGTLPYYNFYQRIHLTAADSTTLVTGDTLNLGTVTTHYSKYTKKLFYSSFDNDDGSSRFDSLLTVVHNSDEACTGVGYGRMHLTADQLTAKFAIVNEDPFIVSDPSNIIYIELDTRSDVRLQVYMHSAYVTGGREDVLPVMVINPTDHWQHMYINLGKTWSYFNHHSTFKISFEALNTDGIEGDIRIDNVKIITSNVVL